MPKKSKKYRHQKYKYLVNIEWSAEDEVYVAKVPELLGCMTHGDSIEEAAHYATEAIDSWIEGAQEAGIEIPEPIATKKLSGRFVTRTDANIHRALLIKAKKMGKSLNGMINEILKEAVT